MSCTILVEGPDGSGKSTLISQLAPALDAHVILGEGPPRLGEDMNKRVSRCIHEVLHYRGLDVNIILDRASAVSEPIYTALRGVPCGISDEMIEQFNTIVRPYVILCTGRGSHVVKDHEEADHVEAVNASGDYLRKAYKRWSRATPLSVSCYDFRNPGSFVTPAHWKL